MKDRVSANPGRVKLTPEDGSPAFYATMERADNPVEEGTPLNKSTLLSDAACDLLEIPQTSTVNDALLAAGALKSRAVTATLTAAGWTGSGPWTQTVTVSGLTSTSNGVVGPTTGVTDTQFEAMQKACLRPSAQSTNSLTIKATGTKPTVNLPIQIIIVG